MQSEYIYDWFTHNLKELLRSYDPEFYATWSYKPTAFKTNREHKERDIVKEELTGLHGRNLIFKCFNDSMAVLAILDIY